ncbi:protein disulfide oxidoreductase [Conservatibacter flavescens]|uniref:Protein disulfide oxidoreductase n=1 Tax=Conservatibacter flavescens TaxID=28161 RepID=A0A2M8S523_9PAST|nr:protein disulfide oxidoreductase [Conservatibacter flavescens]
MKNAIFLLLIVQGASFALDWWRQPKIPQQADQILWHDLQQRPFFLAQMSYERPTLVYFWGTWCGYCRLTSPMINELSDSGIPVVTVALRSGDNAAVQHYLAEHQYHFTTVNDPLGQISQHWQVSVTPTIIAVKNGRMLFATTGLTSKWGLKARLFLAEFFA